MLSSPLWLVKSWDKTVLRILMCIPSANYRGHLNKKCNSTIKQILDRFNTPLQKDLWNPTAALLGAANIWPWCIWHRPTKRYQNIFAKTRGLAGGLHSSKSTRSTICRRMASIPMACSRRIQKARNTARKATNDNVVAFVTEGFRRSGAKDFSSSFDRPSHMKHREASVSIKYQTTCA